MDVVSWLLSRKYTDMSIVGLGSIKGANCTIKDIVHHDGINTVTFEWEGTDGTKKTRDMVVYDGTPIYTYEIGNTYHYGDLVIYKMMFYRCIVSECVATEEIDLSCFDPIGTPDGDFGLVQSKNLLPTRFTSSDRKLYFVLDEDIFYYWDGSAWSPQTNLVQYTTLPTASEKYLGKICQYIGATTSSYINGQFYKCQEVSGSSPTTYEWVSSGNALNTLNDVELTNLSDKQILTWDDTNSKWINEDNNALKQYSIMPSPTKYGEYVQYVGNDTAHYIKGHTYVCIYGADGTTLVWKDYYPRGKNTVLSFSTLDELKTYVSKNTVYNNTLVYIRSYSTYFMVTSRTSGDTEDYCIFISDTQKIVVDFNANDGKIPITAFGGVASANSLENSRALTKAITEANRLGMIVTVPWGNHIIKEPITITNRLFLEGTTPLQSVALGDIGGTSKITFDPEVGNATLFTDVGSHIIKISHIKFACPYTTVTSVPWVESQEIPHEYITWNYTYENVNCLDLANSYLSIEDVDIVGFSGFGLKCRKALFIDSVRISKGKYGFYNCGGDCQYHASFIQGCEYGFYWNNRGTVLFAYDTWIDQCGYGLYATGELSGLYNGEIDHCLYAGIYANTCSTGLKVDARFGRLGMYYAGEDMLEKAKLVTTFTQEAFDDMSKGVDIAIRNGSYLDINVSELPKVIGDSGSGTKRLPTLFLFGENIQGIIKTAYDFGNRAYYTINKSCISTFNEKELSKINALPTPTAYNEGKLFILNSPQTGYIEGGIYKCEEVTPSTSPKTYYWKLINGNGIEYHAGNGIEINGDEISTNIKHYTTMPTNEELFAMSDLTVFETDGFYEQRDGCGGKYIIAVNGLRGGLELSYNNETRWLCVLDDYGNPANEINICKYGVREFVGDITANNITKENTYATHNSYVVTHIRLMRQGGTYKFPKGKFVFADPLDLRERNITFEGAYPPINGTDNYFTGSDYSSCTVLCFPFLQNGECAIITRFNLINLCVYGNYNTYDISFDRTKTITAPNEVVTETIAESNGEQIKCTGIKVSAQSVIQNVTVTGFYTGIERPNPSNGYYFNLFFERCHCGIKFKNDTKCLGLYGYRVYTLAQVNGSICSIDQARVDECVHAIEILQGRDITINDLDGDYCTKELVVIGANGKATLVQGLRLENIHGRFSVLKSYDMTQLPNGYDVRELADTDGYGMIRLTDKVDFKDSHVSINYVVSNPFDDTSNYLVPNIMFTFPTNTYYAITNNIFEIGDNITTSEDILKIFQTKSGMTSRVDCGSRTYYINGSTVEHDIVESDLGTAAFKNSTDRVQPNSTDLVESQSVYSAINTALSSIYTPRGDITCAELTSSLLIPANVGNVYELSDSGTTSALFLQGAGITLNAGDNVGIINAGEGRILFNLMANAFDLTDYQKKDLTTPLTIGGVSVTTVEGALSALNDEMVEFTQAELLAMW